MLNTYYVLSKMLEIREIDHRAIEGRVFYASELCRDGARSKKPGKLPGRTRIERDTCTPMFITALFTIARTWKQPRCPSDQIRSVA